VEEAEAEPILVEVGRAELLLEDRGHEEEFGEELLEILAFLEELTLVVEGAEEEQETLVRLVALVVLELPMCILLKEKKNGLFC
jgi:hypothetical protein